MLLARVRARSLSVSSDPLTLSRLSLRAHAREREKEREKESNNRVPCLVSRCIASCFVFFLFCVFSFCLFVCCCCFFRCACCVCCVRAVCGERPKSGLSRSSLCELWRQWRPRSSARVPSLPVKLRRVAFCKCTLCEVAEILPLTRTSPSCSAFRQI